MRYLRLYLIIRHGAGSIETKVHRDLEALAEEWNCLRDKDTTALVHAGFSCPKDDSVIILFDKFPRRLLVTEAARWALPSDYSVFPVPVGSCDFDDGRNAIPTYVGTGGWGMRYSEEEFREIADSLYESKPMCPWLRYIYSCNPELFLKLALIDVVDDESFALVRNKMPPDEGHEVERLRLRFLKEQVNKDSLWELLSIAPASLLNSDLTELDLSVRLFNIFRLNNIVKVGELKKYSLESLLNLKYMGRKSLCILTDLIWNALTIPENPEDASPQAKAGINENTIIENIKSKETLISIIGNELNSVDERERSIVKSRFGYDGTRITLDQMGKKYSITRERVRQIESKIIKRLNKKVGKKLVTKIKELLRIQKDPLDIEFLELEDSWFEGFLGRYDYLAGVIESLSNDELHVIKISGRSIVSILSQEGWEELVKECISQLKTKGMLGWTRKEVEIFLEVIANKYQVPEMGKLLRHQMEDKLLFAKQEQTEVYVGFGSPVDNLVIAVLTESEKPLHITEISKRIKEKFQRDIEINQITNSTSGALLLGRGTYGLWKHVEMEQNEIDDILDSIEEIMEADRSDKQWSSHELLNRLMDERFDLTEELNPYLIEAFLSKSSKLVSLGRFLWAKRGGEERVPKSRMNITRTCEFILEQAGKPLGERDLFKRISGIRSIGPHQQIQQRGRLIAISPGVWGLLDRDIPLSQEHREELLNTIVGVLKERNKAIHLTEIKDFLSRKKLELPDSLSEYSIYRLAQNDPRLRAGKGRLLGLSEWPNMGRMNLSQAAREVMSTNRRLSLNEIRERIEILVDRSIKSQQVASILQNLGANYDPDDDTYEIK
jgi:hypothetical protein